jgi:uncharacterized protein YukE
LDVRSTLTTDAGGLVAPEDYERLATLVAQESAEVKALLGTMDARLDRMDGRQVTMDARQVTMDARQVTMDARVERLATLMAQESAEVKGLLRTMDVRQDRMDGRQDRMDGRLDRMDGRLDGIEGRLSRVEVIGEETRHLVELVAEGVTGHDVRLRKLERGSTV